MAKRVPTAYSLAVVFNAIQITGATRSMSPFNAGHISLGTVRRRCELALDYSGTKEKENVVGIV